MSEYKPPDSIRISQWATQFRYGIIAIGSILVGTGYGGDFVKSMMGLSQEQLTGYVAAFVTVFGILSAGGTALYGWFNNKYLKDDIKEVVVATAVASAETGVPVQVAVVKTEAGTNNIALPTVISPTDISEAAIVPAGLVPSPPGTTAADERATTAMLNRTQGGI